MGTFESSKYYKVSKFLYDNEIIFYDILIPFFYGIAGIFFGINKEILSYKIHSFWLGGFFVLGAFFLSIMQALYKIKNNNKMTILEDECGLKDIEIQTISLKTQNLENQISMIHKNHKEICVTHLSFLFEKLRLGNSDRISLYIHKDDSFFIIGRYSCNQTLSKTVRPFYPQEGLIYKAWMDEEYFINEGIPIYGPNTRDKNRYYSAINDIAPIPRETVDAMKMKSRSFYIKALKDSQGIHRNSIIVIESLESNIEHFKKEVIETVVATEERKLVTFVEKIDWNFPELSNAKNEGF